MNLDTWLRDFRSELAQAHRTGELEELRTRHLGRRSHLKAEFRTLGDLPEGERRAYAMRLNAIAASAERELDDAWQDAHRAETDQRLEAERIDISLPGQAPRRGSWHPVTQVERRCFSVLRRLGFQRVEGPEVEDAYHNFDALNVPQHHPARDMQDTFWLEQGLLLRSHTTTIQARILGQGPPVPIKAAASGRVYRNEAVDVTHLAMFHQLEGFWLEPGLTVGHLKQLLTDIARSLYGADVRLRFKPKHYPYTEPSLGVDLACTTCQGNGCEACHGTGWVTIIGAGMIHPAVLREFGYDRDDIRGIAFGWGLTRMTTQWLGLTHVRSLYQSDQRYLTHLHRGHVS
ncbi:phenylalanine--tRNA ligase subunit alpha [Streptomyces sp. IBSNAI002]|uniref:phenylalanine--tRNA ligase subunit alpha n=1 Tax=Streptomyces sp. IBSNAI002 TaxID=3457500 RepID=UPI003FD3A8B1